MKPLIFSAWLLASALSAQSESLEGRVFDLTVVEATPGGIAMAVRAAREGLSVLLVNHNAHLGGILSSGLGVWDTQWEGKRSPIYDEARQAIFDHYRSTYGENSPQYRNALPGKSGHTNGKFEPRVAEKVFTELVAREKRITVLTGFVPVGAYREGALLKDVTFRDPDGARTVRVTAKVFADCSYEGDLAALAKVPCRVGREARAEFNEPHAGKVFMRGWSKPPTPEAATLLALHDSLKLRRFPGGQSIVAPDSTGEGDGNVQAFNYRTILSSDPANRVPAERPAGYDPEFLKTLEFGSIVQPIPNKKIGWNRPQLVGPHVSYVEGGPAARRNAMDAHWRATMGLLWFLQHDDSVPEAKRRFWQQYGLARDEFADNGHRPYEFYVREARRIVGRYVFTEHDATLAPGLQRAPLHADSIGVTEWYLDTHACTKARAASGSLDEGKMMLHHETFPGQVSYRALLPQGVDNLLVPVCLSATHVAWGTIRLEPTWMNIAEAAAFAVVQALKHQQPPAAIRADKLLRTLAARRVMISFFNDVDLSSKEPWVAAVQYFGAKGFFHSYNAKPGAPLSEPLAKIWADGFAQLRAGKLDANALARAVASAEAAATAEGVTVGRFLGMLPGMEVFEEGGPINRGEACRLMFALLEQDDAR